MDAINYVNEHLLLIKVETYFVMIGLSPLNYKPGRLAGFFSSVLSICFFWDFIGGA